MSQDNTVVADGNGAQVLAAINAALLTLKTCHSGNAAPADPAPLMFWADTSNNKMKQRNAANNAWIELWELTAGTTLGASVVQTVITTVGSGTWAKPSKGTIVRVQCWGGGGGGQWAVDGGGGGGGGYSEKWIMLADLPASVSYTVGNGGAPNTAGGTTQFSTVIATGGSPGNSAATVYGGSPQGIRAGSGFDGGNGGGGASLWGGGGGGSSNYATNSQFPGGGSAYGGPGGISGKNNVAAGSGTAPSGGGGGFGVNSSSAGSGARGQIILTVF